MPMRIISFFQRQLRSFGSDFLLLSSGSGNVDYIFNLNFSVRGLLLHILLSRYGPAYLKFKFERYKRECPSDYLGVNLTYGVRVRAGTLPTPSFCT